MSTKRLYAMLLAVGILTASAVTLLSVTVGPSYAGDGPNTSSGCTNSN